MGRWRYVSSAYRTYCRVNYKFYIQLFDILSFPWNPQKTVRTKRDPHWSQENGTYKMLGHDAIHIKYQMRHALDKNLEKVCAVLQKYPRASNEYRILAKGLFILAPEIIPGVIFGGSGQHQADLQTLIDGVDTSKDGINVLLRDRLARAGSMASRDYKQGYRDLEYVLEDVHDGDSSKPLLPMIVIGLFVRKIYQRKGARVGI